MARSVITALSFAVLLAVLDVGSALRCYQCHSINDPSCKDPFSGSKNLVDCQTQDSVNYNRGYLRNFLPSELVDSTVAGASRFCHKIVMRGGAVVRTCLDANPSDLNQTCRLLASSSDPTRMIQHCSVCDKEGCNGAGSIVASIPLAGLALFASYLYYKL